MRTDQPILIRRTDYRPPAFAVERVHLDVALDPSNTRVKARLQIAAQGDGPHDELVLDGEAMKLVSIAIDGAPLARGAYAVHKDRLVIKKPPRQFSLETEVLIDPGANTSLSGLYLSDGILCTQCEAEGFRRITYYIDRPDNMAVFSVRMEAVRAQFPVLLANGNRTASGTLPGGRHFAVWEDPFKKPSYLFAMVAGRLDVIEDSFKTASGRKVALQIYVEPGNGPKATYAMDALKRSMRWDEKVFGREYDLDIFMIVAVSAFNFGAMENKGLNIFNDRYILADPQTATDVDYSGIEGVVAHEYFHNWTGNRITCRDWFQLCLKEGLTVFRDQLFSQDMNSAAVERIEQVKTLRLRQFPEDDGPLAHPPRPDSYMTIDNFYTATVYEKGAEICRMLRTVLGAEGFRAGMDLYFTRHDGEATTVDAFVQCFADATGADLSQFALWWSQAGTPRVSARGRYDAASRTYTLTLTQQTLPTPGQKTKQPMHIPLRLALLDPSGAPMPVAFEGEAPWLAPRERVVHLTAPRQVFRFTGLAQAPVPSLNRGFSAPVRLSMPLSANARALLMGRDDDLFSRWDAGQALARDQLLAAAETIRKGGTPRVPKSFLGAVGALLADAERDRHFSALALQLPSEQDLALASTRVDPEALHIARRTFMTAMGRTHHDALAGLYDRLSSAAPYAPTPEQVGRRALRNEVLRLLAATAMPADLARVSAHYAQARNMTDMAAALGILSHHDTPDSAAAFDDFLTRFHAHPLVVDKWFTLQALSSRADQIAHLERLTRHPAFTLANPNRFRSLVSAFAFNNQLRFHEASGAGYRFVADMALKMDKRNPLVAARLLGAFESWRRFDRGRQARMKAELDRIAATRGLSKNCTEVVTRMLGSKT